MQAFVLLLIIAPSLYALKCYNYLSSSENKKPSKTWVNCPVEAQYCFKNYSNEKVSSVWLSERACGTPNLCTVRSC
ncbi:UPAR/Ly6 domain-containing protein [Trichostrongylus colubriformis]|uniref:UPAR/Ly6 domain-containing protein n=1 Tax=Trichostrongylus colubriformis TaxID=6319 RepID=A0AAN8GAJ9_TRICO